MARPKAVQKAAEEAERLAKEAVQHQNSGGATSGKSLDDMLQGTGDEPGPAPDDRGATPPDTDPARRSDTPHQDSPTATPDNLGDELRRERERYQALKGKYDSEVTRVHEHNRELSEENGRLKQRVTTLESELDKALQQPAMSEKELQEARDRLSEDLTDDAVEGITSLVESIVKSNLPKREELDAGQRATLESELEGLRKEQRKVANLSAQAQLDRLAEGWRTLNEDPDFNDWIETETDWRTGETYKALMNGAWKRGDIAIVANFFNEFARQQSSQQPGTTADASEGVQPSGTGVGDRPEPTASGGNGQKTWSMAEIEDIERRARAGEWRKPEQKRKLRALRDEIARATAEGRVTQ